MKRWAFWAVISLVIMLVLPVLALLVMEQQFKARCHVEIKQSGALDRLIEWRISKTTCESGRSYHDVEIGPAGRALTPAFTASEAVPVSVVKLADGVAGIVVAGEQAPVPVKLRTSGSAAQRIDYDGRKSP